MVAPGCTVHQSCLSPYEDLVPHLIQVYMVPCDPSPHPEWHLDWLRCFCRVCQCVWHIMTLTMPIRGLFVV